jgi:hypothetical protein
LLSQMVRSRPPCSQSGGHYAPQILTDVWLCSKEGFRQCQTASSVKVSAERLALPRHACIDTIPAADICVSRAVDDMGSRIDELEKSIGDIMAQAGIEDETEGEK